MPIRIGQRPDHTFDEPLGLLSDCHRRIEQFLRVLVTIAERADGRSLTPSQRADLEAAIAYFATAAPKHTADEEESLFPRLRRSDDPAAARALETVARLEHDHAEADRHHRAVETLVTRWLADGVLEPGDSRDLRRHLNALGKIYLQHIAIEDDELFPAAQRLLTADQVHEIGQEMAARRSIPITARTARPGEPLKKSS